MRFFKVCAVALFVIGWMMETAAQNQPPNPTPPEKNQDSAQPAPRPCSKSRLLDFKVTRDGEDARNVTVWQVSDSPAFFYESGMYIDADGAPNAYNPQDTGLDDLANAGEPGPGMRSLRMRREIPSFPGLLRFDHRAFRPHQRSGRSRKVRRRVQDSLYCAAACFCQGNGSALG